jgi:hypothetical protein
MFWSAGVGLAAYWNLTYTGCPQKMHSQPYFCPSSITVSASWLCSKYNCIFSIDRQIERFLQQKTTLGMGHISGWICSISWWGWWRHSWVSLGGLLGIFWWFRHLCWCETRVWLHVARVGIHLVILNWSIGNVRHHRAHLTGRTAYSFGFAADDTLR